MVDALLSAAAESDSSPFDDFMMSSTNDRFIDDHQPPLRFCEFCNSSNTPTWRRGPAGKGSLCNACGIKWRLRKRLKKNEKGSPSPPPTIPDKKASPVVAKSTKKRKESDMYSKSPNKSPNKFKDTDSNGEFLPPTITKESNKRKKYYCKYCDQTFSLSQFRNSQQFGAHCSNCSRRPRDEDSLFEDGNVRYDRYSSPYSPSSFNETGSPSTPESPTPPNSSRDGLLLRLLHVVEHQLVDVHELAEIKDELSTLRTELITREEARKAELGVLRARFKEDIADLKMGFRRSVAAHEQLAAHRLMEMEQTIRIRGGSLA